MNRNTLLSVLGSPWSFLSSRLFQGVITLLFPHHHLFYTSKEIRGRGRWEERDQGQSDDFGRRFIWKRSQTSSLGICLLLLLPITRCWQVHHPYKAFLGQDLDAEGWLLDGFPFKGEGDLCYNHCPLGQLLPDEHNKFISDDFVQVSPTRFTSQRIEESPINSLIVFLGRCLLSVTLQGWQGKPLPDVLLVASFLLLVFVKTDLI